MSAILPRAAVVATLGALLMPAAAPAARPGHRSFVATYPIASHLCAATARGHAPRRLRSDVPAVLAACGRLQSIYDQAVTTGQAAVDAHRSAVVQARALKRATCVSARAAHDPAACQAARQTLRTTLQSQRESLRGSLQQYRASIEGARHDFWAKIHELRGGAGLPSDQPKANAVPPSGN